MKTYETSTEMAVRLNALQEQVEHLEQLMGQLAKEMEEHIHLFDSRAAATGRPVPVQ